MGHEYHESGWIRMNQKQRITTARKFVPTMSWTCCSCSCTLRLSPPEAGKHEAVGVHGSRPKWSLQSAFFCYLAFQSDFLSPRIQPTFILAPSCNGSRPCPCVLWPHVTTLPLWRSAAKAPQVARIFCTSVSCLGLSNSGYPGYTRPTPKGCSSFLMPVVCQYYILEDPSHEKVRPTNLFSHDSLPTQWVPALLQENPAKAPCHRHGEELSHSQWMPPPKYLWTLQPSMDQHLCPIENHPTPRQLHPSS